MSTEPAADHEREAEIRLTFDGEWWVARDAETGVASQGKTREGALENLDEAVALHRGEIGEPVTDEDLEELGIDPDAIPDEPQVPDAPWFDADDEEPAADGGSNSEPVMADQPEPDSPFLSDRRDDN